ncbi:hypothetical protein [Xenorhabdus japonica]|uniref:Uncharacterized protein n=1 Tax=Xenorhabdus japonica TaxID=53341 RepID=A0A1I5CD25_9GAMM|nr:hypothetical protein [Xenorhabdus japonica]SFN84826.1 hypothetical protein SAMN05421579_12555 [Xenorhabdus japonica]
MCKLLVILNAMVKSRFYPAVVPLLAFAGLSVGGQLEELKKISWKVIVIFMVVSTCCCFYHCSNWIQHKRGNLVDKNQYNISEKLFELNSFSKKTRQDLHKIPELSGQEFKTSQ